MKIVSRMAFVWLLLSALATDVGATTYQVVIDTSAIGSTAVVAAFDFIDGGPPGNSVRISGLTTTGIISTPTMTGDVSGILSSTITLSDGAFFNELLVPIDGVGAALSFLVELTGNSPAPGSLPDAFSFFLLEPASGLPLFRTDDITGADALMQIDIDGSAGGALTIIGVPGGEVTLNASIVRDDVPSVPVPPSLSLLALGLTALTCFKSGTKRRDLLRACKELVG